MYVEFESNKLVNTNFFGRVTKKDKEVDNTIQNLQDEVGEKLAKAEELQFKVNVF